VIVIVSDEPPLLDEVLGGGVAVTAATGVWKYSAPEAALLSVDPVKLVIFQR
jgi:hypothetical protein